MPQRALELRDEGIPLCEMAVLYRSHFHALELQLELTRRNIPFVKYGGLKFLEAAHIKDLLALLRILENPADEISWFRVLLLLQGIGSAAAARPGKGSSMTPRSIWSISAPAIPPPGIAPCAAATATLTVSVLAPSCALADALTKVFFMCPPERLAQTAHAWGVAAVLQSKQGKWVRVGNPSMGA